MTQRAASPVARSAIAGRPAPGCSALKRNGSAIFPGLFTNQSKIDAFGLFTGQIGYAVNNVLLYAKGGAALTDNRFNTYFTPTGVLVGSAAPPLA